MVKTNVYRVWTGPTMVQDVRDHLLEAFSRVMSGTEAVWIHTTADPETVLAKIQTKFSGFKLSDVHLVRTEDAICVEDL